MEQMTLYGKDLPPPENLINDLEKLPQHAMDLSSGANQGELLPVANQYLRLSKNAHSAATFQALCLAPNLHRCTTPSFCGRRQAEWRCHSRACWV